MAIVVRLRGAAGAPAVAAAARLRNFLRNIAGLYMIEEDMNISRRQAITAVAGLGLSSCANNSDEAEKKKSLVSTASKGKVDKHNFGNTSDGQAVELYTLTNTGGSS